MINFNILGVHGKIRVLEGVVSRKTSIEGVSPKKGGLG